MSAFSAEDGRRQWRSRVVGAGHQPRIQTMPTVVGETVFVSGTDYRLYAVNATDGTTRWETQLLDQTYGNSIPSVTVVDDTLYVNTIHGGLLTLRRSDGTERWRTGEYGGNLPPAAAGDLIFAPTFGSVQAYTAAGKHRWEFEMEAFETETMGAYAMDTEVAVAHNRVYVTLNDGRVFSLGAK